MPVSKADYLASKYLTASTPSSSTKKRKRKNAANEGLIIADDEDLGWSKSTEAQDEDDGRPITVTSGSAEFRKAKKNAWKTVGIAALQPRDSEADEADKIIAQTAQENEQREDDEEPVVEEGVVKMGDGTHAGLQSASAVAAQFAKRKKEEKETWEREEKERKKNGVKGEETVYRDATGRRIDISLRRAEARRELDAAAKKELEEKEAQKGDIQRLEKERRKEELYEAKLMPLARKVDDEDMNAEMREQERWNDPAAQFLVKKGKGKSKTGKELYKGAWAPNRYGIAPGHRWDGVDRGNGWEGERFKAVNRKTRNKELDFAWQMDT